MFYKREDELAFFGGNPDKEWSLATESEINNYKLVKAKEKKAKEVKQATESLILSQYSDRDQLNILMSGDNIQIANMNSVIEPILTKSRSIRSEILNCDTLEKLNKINTDF